MIRSSGHRNWKKPFSCGLDTEESGLAWSVVTNLFGKGPVHLSQVYTFLLLSRSHENGMLYIFFKKVQFYQLSFNKQTWLSMDNKLNEGSKIVSYYFGDEVEIHLHTPTNPHTFPYFTLSFTKWHNTIKVTEWRGLSNLSAQLLTQHDWPLTLTLKYDLMMSSSSFKKIKTFVKTCLLLNWKKRTFLLSNLL